MTDYDNRVGITSDIFVKNSIWPSDTAPYYNEGVSVDVNAIVQHKSELVIRRVTQIHFGLEDFT